MPRYLLHKHLRNSHGEINNLHRFCRLDLSEGSHNPTTINIQAATDLLVVCGNKPVPLYILINRDATVKLQIIAPDASVDWSLNLALDQNVNLEVTMADFGPFSGVLTINSELHGENSCLHWHLASLARQTENKKYIVNFNHRAPNTQAIMTNFGVLEDAATLTFTGTGHIYRGALKSQTHQQARILVFDKSCHGQADPILAIDENDVGASHAATVGRLNEEHLFYLKSRGLSEEDARQLITYGYLKPAIASFTDIRTQQALFQLLEARI